MLAVAVAAAMPVVSFIPRAAQAHTLNEVDQALVLLADAAAPTDPELLAAGIDQYNRGQFEEAQVTLQQVKVDGLPQADRDRLADTLRKVEGALTERKTARAEFEAGERALEQKNYTEAAQH